MVNKTTFGRGLRHLILCLAGGSGIKKLRLVGGRRYLNILRLAGGQDFKQNYIIDQFDAILYNIRKCKYTN